MRGIGGPNYWYTDTDALEACRKALDTVTFVVSVLPNHQFLFRVGKREAAGGVVIMDTGSSVFVQPPLENQEIASLPISCGVTAELAIGFSGRCAVYHFSNAAG